MSLIYWIGNPKTNRWVDITKYGILSFWSKLPKENFWRSWDTASEITCQLISIHYLSNWRNLQPFWVLILQKLQERRIFPIMSVRLTGFCGVHLRLYYMLKIAGKGLECGTRIKLGFGFAFLGYISFSMRPIFPPITSF